MNGTFWSTTIINYFFVCRKDGISVITPSDGDIALEITVTNKNGDDAHQSQLDITLPDTLHYSTIAVSVSIQKSAFTQNGKWI